MLDTTPTLISQISFQKNKNEITSTYHNIKIKVSFVKNKNINFDIKY